MFHGGRLHHFERKPQMKIKHYFLLIMTTLALAACSPHDVSWFGKSDEKKKLAETERLLAAQRGTIHQWELVAGSLGLGCVLLFLIGTALGSRTRHAART